MVNYRDMTDKEREEYTKKSIEDTIKREKKFKKKHKRRINFSRCVKQVTVNLDHPFDFS